MTAGETYYLHCPMCGEEIEVQMEQVGQESLTGERRCDCGQPVTINDRRTMNVSALESIARGQRVEVTIADGAVDGDD